MPKLTLAKCLKLKNRLAGRLTKVEADIQSYNSVLEEKVGQVDVGKLFKTRFSIVGELVDLKTKIILTNAPIQSLIIQQGELKSTLTFLQGIPTRHGEERHAYQNTTVKYVANMQKAEVDKQTRELEARIDAIQDKLDEFNHATLVDVNEEALKLAAG